MSYGDISKQFFTGLYTNWYLGHNLVGLGVALHVRFGRCWLPHLSGDCEAIGGSKEPSNPRSWMGTGGCVKPANLPANLPPNNVCDGLGTPGRIQCFIHGKSHDFAEHDYFRGASIESLSGDQRSKIDGQCRCCRSPAGCVDIGGWLVDGWWMGGWLVDGWWMLVDPHRPKTSIWGMRGQSSKPRGRPVSPLHRLFETRKL